MWDSELTQQLRHERHGSRITTPQKLIDMTHSKVGKFDRIEMAKQRHAGIVDQQVQTRMRGDGVRGELFHILTPGHIDLRVA